MGWRSIASPAGANALILLDRGMKFEEVAQVLLIDDSTIRVWLKAYDEGGVEELVLFDLKGGLNPAFSPEGVGLR